MALFLLEDMDFNPFYPDNKSPTGFVVPDNKGQSPYSCRLSDFSSFLY